MDDFLVNVALLVLILGSSAMATNLYVRWSYNRCAACGSLNAKRRDLCRVCGQSLRG
jgi:hypothetical protein